MLSKKRSLCGDLRLVQGVKWSLSPHCANGMAMEGRRINAQNVTPARFGHMRIYSLRVELLSTEAMIRGQVRVLTDDRGWPSQLQISHVAGGQTRVWKSEFQQCGVLERFQGPPRRVETR